MKNEEVLDIIKNYKNSSNKDLMNVLDFLKEDFDKTKEIILKLTYHLDGTEDAYNKILEEVNNRTKNV
jgi:site-specific DNA-adenine methylase